MIILKSEPKAKPNNRKRESERNKEIHCILFLPVSPRPAYAVFFTKYWLKLSVLCDLLEIILCTLGPEASETESSH